ncbi:isoprenyl transferase [Aureibacter tunicatorum]|uniref:Isoprenyl transferase n=1 Tax=Aureibacter tunicatorum TaxID=866807 RepID=A0AAE3XI08_9BACT|nr:isoprenyl transferase [Aureibacter tunicatorum]MDR6238071.1 undecaprenyl diphosphate synthase [Aureibacter tunicatorum]BDD03104.1 isoprenyl transferase [Aureibacter tunicatorum]
MNKSIDKDRIPKHIAIIMDGNGRWAKKQGMMDRVFGHKHAIKTVKNITDACGKLGVEYLTLYAFSTENWNRPRTEVNALMTLLVSTLKKEIKELDKNGVKLKVIGEMSELPKTCQVELNQSMELTKDNKGLQLNLALSYSGRSEITVAMKKMVEMAQKGTLNADQVNEEFISKQLYTAGMPDPDLMIRTSGEMRISNFLLWQIAYSEIYITDVLWPDFTVEHLYDAIADYQGRERRFGKTSEQLQH